jgi:hypothetical protein
MPIALKSGSLNVLEPSGPVHAYTGIALQRDGIRNPSSILSWIGVLSAMVSIRSSKHVVFPVQIHLIVKEVNPLQHEKFSGPVFKDGRSAVDLAIQSG